MKPKPPAVSKRKGHDPNQAEFGIIWQLTPYPFGCGRGMSSYLTKDFAGCSASIIAVR